MKQGESNEKLSSKLKNMVKMFPVPNSILVTKVKFENGSLKKKSESEDFTTFDINGLNHKPIEECDHLFEDCENFLKLAKDTIQFTTQSANPTKLSSLGLNLGSTINKFRAKRKGNSLFLMFEALQERMETVENQLKSLSEESKRNSNSLILQSLHLKARLKACIEYNKIVAEQLKPLIAEASALFDSLRQSEISLQSMLTFFDEVSLLSRNQPYVPWAMRAPESGSSFGFQADVKVSRKALIRRCANLTKVSCHSCCMKLVHIFHTGEINC
jgi:hypothetical protein